MEDVDVEQKEAEQDQLKYEAPEHDFLSDLLCTLTSGRLESYASNLRYEGKYIRCDKEWCHTARAHQGVVPGIKAAYRSTKRHVDGSGDQRRRSNNEHSLQYPRPHVVGLIACPGSPVVSKGRHCALLVSALRGRDGGVAYLCLLLSVV